MHGSCILIESLYGTDEQGRQALDAPVRGLLQGSPCSLLEAPCSPSIAFHAFCACRVSKIVRQIIWPHQCGYPRV